MKFSLKRLCEIINLLNNTVIYYNQWIANSSTVQLSALMDPPLLAQTYGIVDLVRGWAPNETEERAKRDMALRFLRSATMYYCLEYTRILVQQLIVQTGLEKLDDNDRLNYATLLSILTNNWQWKISEDPVVNWELSQFRKFRIAIRDRPDFPVFQLTLRDASPIRFIEDFSTNSDILRSWLYSRPIPGSPELNRDNEERILFQAQTFTLNCYKEFCEHKNLTLLRYMSPELMKLIIEINVNLSSEQIYKEFDLKNLITASLIQRCFQFLYSEYNRFECHPYHQRHPGDYAVAIRENHATLLNAANNLASHIGAYTKIGIFMTLYRHIRHTAPIHVGYSINAEGATLRFHYGCNITELVQNHYTYEKI